MGRLNISTVLYHRLGEKRMNAMKYKNFGDFLYRKRKENKITMRQVSEEIGCTQVYISDVEKDRRNSFDIERLRKLVKFLNLTDEERDLMYDLAGKKRNEVAPDLHDYITENYYVRMALRTCRDLDIGEEGWNRIVEAFKKRKG